MAEEYSGEKVLPPSPRKIERARQRGQVARSTDLSAAAMLLFALIALWQLGPGAFGRLLQITEHFFGDAHAIHLEQGFVQSLLIQTLLFVVPVVLPFMLILLAGGILINVVQFGILFAPEALEPKIERIDPFKGFQRFFSVRSLVELLKSIFKLSLISLVVWFTMRNRISEILSLMHFGPDAAGVATWDLLLDVWWRIVAVMIVIGIIDYAFQRWHYNRDLMMTQQEARQELKQLEGDPLIRQRIRNIQRQMAMQRMMGEVPEADVVITNPTTYAIAVRYLPHRMDAPEVVAKGARLVAERIRALAVEHDVPIVERPELARILYRTVEIGHGIPADLFRTVAEVLAYVYQIDRRASKLEERAEAELPTVSA